MSAPRLTEPMPADWRPPARVVPFRSAPPPRAPSPWRRGMVLAVVAIVIAGGGWVLVRTRDTAAPMPVTDAPLGAASAPSSELPVANSDGGVASAQPPAVRVPITKPASPARRRKPTAPKEILEPWGDE